VISATARAKAGGFRMTREFHTFKVDLEWGIAKMKCNRLIDVALAFVME